MQRFMLPVFRILVGLLGATAIATEIITIVGRGIWNPANFFSYFTIESNLIAATIFLVSGIYALTGKRSDRLDFLRGANTFYMILVGIVFAIFLSGLENVQLTAVPWDNTVLHYLVPIAAVVDWLLDPPRTRIPFKRALIWLVFPVAFLVYSLIRGPVVDWYPYPFLNPANGGYEQVAITVLGIAVGGIIMAFLVTRISIRQR